MIICRVDAAAAGTVQAEAASLEERGGCGTFRGRDTQAWVTEDGDGEVGAWGSRLWSLVVMLDCKEMESAGQRELRSRLAVR